MLGDLHLRPQQLHIYNVLLAAEGASIEPVESPRYGPDGGNATAYSTFDGQVYIGVGDEVQFGIGMF